MTAPTLTEFLLARIAEDEERFAPQPGDDQTAQSGDLNEGYIVGLHERLRAECEAKRRVVEKARRSDDAVNRQINPATAAASFALIEVLTYMTLPYADHPDYRDEWRP